MLADYKEFQAFKKWREVKIVFNKVNKYTIRKINGIYAVGFGSIRRVAVMCMGLNRIEKYTMHGVIDHNSTLLRTAVRSWLPWGWYQGSWGEVQAWEPHLFADEGTFVSSRKWATKSYLFVAISWLEASSNCKPRPQRHQNSRYQPFLRNPGWHVMEFLTK